jgi:hypothetical protein
MGGHDQQRAPLEKILDDRCRQGCPFLGIGSRSELIEKNQRAFGGPRDDARQSHQIRRKCGEMLEDALIVSHQHVNGVDDRNHRSIGGRQRKAAHGHGYQKPGRLQRHGFPAGVRTADDERRSIRVQLHCHRDHPLAAGLAEGLLAGGG